MIRFPRPSPSIFAYCKRSKNCKCTRPGNEAKLYYNIAKQVFMQLHMYGIWSMSWVSWSTLWFTAPNNILHTLSWHRDHPLPWKPSISYCIKTEISMVTKRQTLPWDSSKEIISTKQLQYVVMVGIVWLCKSTNLVDSHIQANAMQGDNK